MHLILQESKKREAKRHRPKYKCQYVHCFCLAYLPQFYFLSTSSLPGRIQSMAQWILLWIPGSGLCSSGLAKERPTNQRIEIWRFSGKEITGWNSKMRSRREGKRKRFFDLRAQLVKAFDSHWLIFSCFYDMLFGAYHFFIKNRANEKITLLFWILRFIRLLSRPSYIIWLSVSIWACWDFIYDYLSFVAGGVYKLTAADIDSHMRSKVVFPAIFSDVFFPEYQVSWP